MSGGRGGYVGPLPGGVGLVNAGLDAQVLTRWDRWWELCSARELPARLDPSRPAWRLATRAGLFGPEPLAGVFRLGRDRLGRTYPFAVLRPGPWPSPTDPWFDAVERFVVDATGGAIDPAAIDWHFQVLPVPHSVGPAPEGAAVLWRDGRAVWEVPAATAADLAAFPLRLAAEEDPEDTPAEEAA